MRGSPDDPAAREAVLRQLSSPQMRQQLLQEMLQTELSCRRARELKLDREEEYIQARDQMIDALLASHFLTRQLRDARPTAVDLEAYYSANRRQYEQPESIDVVSIKLKPDEDPGELASQIESADGFRKLAKDRREGDADDATDGPPPTRRVIRGASDVVLGDTEALFDLPQEEWTKEPHTGADGEKYFVLVQRKNAARIPALEEIEPQVRAAYTARKQQELSQQLFRDLMTRYDVRLVAPGKPDDKPDNQTDEASEQAKEEKKP